MARMLIVDDEAAMRSMLRVMLGTAGFEDIVEAANGREAVQRLQEGCPALMMTDIYMPDMDGLETIREARRLCPALPIMAMSGTVWDAHVDMLPIARHLGATTVLRKPFTMHELFDAVHALLSPPPLTSRTGQK